jgi:hypothetical protein
MLGMSDAPPALVVLVLATCISTLQAGVADACPGSPARVMHASANVHVVFAHSCDVVASEIFNRVNGASGWVDPHNEGHYTLLSQQPASGTPTKINLSRRTGDDKYTDKMDLQFTPTTGPAGANSGCEIEACSESQVTSYADFSTNYCNLHNLYCGSDDGCPYSRQDLQSHESQIHTGAGASKDKSQCVKSPTALCLVELQSLCGTDFVQGTAQCNTCAGLHQQDLRSATCSQAVINGFCAGATGH